MRNISWLIAVVLLSSAAATQRAWGEKITVDQNTPEARSATEERSSKVDVRLAQKVTYEGGYKRLHNVAEDLSAITGVKIRAGRSSKDWRVRDIPLVVCVRDLPLGKLLHALADCAHVKLAAETTRVVLPGEEELSEEDKKPSGTESSPSGDE